MRKRDPSEVRQERAVLQAAFEAGELDLADAVRAMRHMLGLNQAEYAKRVGVAARAVIDLERRVGNPTLSTILKMGKPFGLTVTYRLPRTVAGSGEPLIKPTRDKRRRSPRSI